MHADEVPIDADLVAALVAEQFPQWDASPVRELQAAGTENRIFRLGSELTARFARRQRPPAQLATELRAEADAADALSVVCPVPTPRPIAIGAPGRGYPMPWRLQTWVPGPTADELDPGGSTAFALDLADLILAMRSADTGGRTFGGTGRGGNLRDHDGRVAEYLARSEGLLDVRLLEPLWTRFRDLPREGDDVMTHGDVIPGNVLVRPTPAGIRLAGVLDAGGFGPADPALDLVAAWHLLDDGPRAILRRRLDVDELQWTRGRAWAFEQAVGLVAYYLHTNPGMSALGRRTLDRLVATR